MKLYQCFIALLIISLIAFGAPKYPFPQAVKYKYGILPANISSDKAQAAYADFYTRLYEENGDQARIKWDKLDTTVSEGIGYGMIIMVYMDNATNSTQAKFDKLWKYYNSNLDKNGLMNWKIYKFPDVGMNGQNSATDAELDVAFALLEAYKQWGDQKYLNDAKSLVDKIVRYEVNSGSGFLKPGDGWDDKQNPSYYSTAAFTLFKNASSYDWGKMIITAYTLLKKSRNTTTGLVPDWCSQDGQAQDTFSYDAIRVPWRLAWAYCWNGDEDAKTICSDIASWITVKTSGDPAKIVDEYNLDGSNTSKGQYQNGTWVGCLASAGLVDAKHQAWLDAAYERLSDTLGPKKEVYYSQSLKVLNLLLMSGNMPDFWNMPVTAVCPAISGKAPMVPVINVNSSRGVINASMTPGAYIMNIYNSEGRRVSEPLFGRSEGVTISIPLKKDLRSGAYWLCLLTTSGSSTARMIISR
jgi:endoglucanase